MDRYWKSVMSCIGVKMVSLCLELWGYDEHIRNSERL